MLKDSSTLVYGAKYRWIRMTVGNKKVNKRSAKSVRNDYRAAGTYKTDLRDESCCTGSPAHVSDHIVVLRLQISRKWLEQNSGGAK